VLNTQYSKLWLNCLAKIYKKKAKAPGTDRMVLRIGTVCQCPENWGARPCLVTRPDRAKSLLLRRRLVLDRVQSGPRSTTCPKFGLRSRPVRFGPGPMHTPIASQKSWKKEALDQVETKGMKEKGTHLDFSSPANLWPRFSWRLCSHAQLTCPSPLAFIFRKKKNDLLPW